MIYFIYVVSKDHSDKEIHEKRMDSIHLLESEGHATRYTWFDSPWWGEASMRDRGIKNIPLHFLAKNIEEMSKCDGIFFNVDLLNVEYDEVGKLLRDCAQQYGLEIRYSNIKGGTNE